jgi:hypothetical protein
MYDLVLQSIQSFLVASSKLLPMKTDGVTTTQCEYLFGISSIVAFAVRSETVSI